MKWKSINDKFGRRSGTDRRKEDSPDIEEDRRKLNDRRKVPDRRTGTERRTEPGSEGSKQTGKDKRKNPVDRRDFIFPDD